MSNQRLDRSVKWSELKNGDGPGYFARLVRDTFKRRPRNDGHTKDQRKQLRLR